MCKMTDRELLQQALDALKMSYELQDNGLINFEEYKLISDADILIKLQITIEAIKARLTQPEPKPVGCITEVHTKTAYGGTVGIEPQMYGRLPVGTLLYTAPPKKEWVGLMDEEIIDIWAGVSTGYDDEINIVHLGKAIEAKLKEKNT